MNIILSVVACYSQPCRVCSPNYVPAYIVMFKGFMLAKYSPLLFIVTERLDYLRNLGSLSRDQI